MKSLRAPDFKEHLRAIACESKPLQCIVSIKTMANITSRGIVSSNHHLFLHSYITLFKTSLNYIILMKVTYCINYITSNVAANSWDIW